MDSRLKFRKVDYCVNGEDDRVAVYHDSRRTIDLQFYVSNEKARGWQTFVVPGRVWMVLPEQFRWRDE